jgi:formylglycine-generating enzyme required for sulfatase activity
MAGKIFISYRRSGSPKDALLVYKHLAAEFGADAVFMDVSGIRPGDDFVEVLKQQLAGCNVLLALIGPDWLHAKNEHGGRKLDDEDDFVRVEIRTALQRRMRVVPLLLDGAPMPRRIDLPEDLHPMVRRQGLAVDATNLHHFRSAMERLEEVLRESLATGGLPWMDMNALIKTAQVAAEFHSTQQPAEPWMSAEGSDTYGRWADLQANGETQRLRWIAPGRFRMGSPSSEVGRFEDEDPQHEVTLTRGFWLADTACTQALWQAVVGSNPSGFKGDLQRPVDSVSWDDVTGLFLPKLKDLLGGRADVLLPTEAEWEYACRAGTTTAYSFGDRFDPAEVHVQAEETVPVKALAPNAWGLHQMHGNVWEWCADAKRTYAASAVENPDGGQDGVGRVLRGGSWGIEAGCARSACRYLDTRFSRIQDFGFRFALRSIEPGAGGR